MPVLSCPDCRTSVEIDAEHLGQEVECGKCQHVFVAQTASRDWGDRDDDDRDDRPRRRRRSRGYEEFEEDEGSYDEAKDTVRGPANGLIWLGWLGAFVHFAGGIAALVLGVHLQDQPQMGKKDEDDAMMLIILGGLAAVTGPIYYTLIAIGGHRLKSLNGTAWPIASAIMGIATIALCGICSPFTWAGIGMGIWTLVVINRPIVKWAMSRPLQRGKDGAEF